MAAVNQRFLISDNTLTLPGQAVDSLWSDCARWILGLFTMGPTGSCSFFPANANCEKAVWYPGVSSMSIKCSSSGMVSSSGNSKRPIRDCNKGVLDLKQASRQKNQVNTSEDLNIQQFLREVQSQELQGTFETEDGHQFLNLSSRTTLHFFLATARQFPFWKLLHPQSHPAGCKERRPCDGS